MNKLLLGRYIQGESFVHRLDPRTKLIASFAFILLIFLATTIWGYLLLAVFTCLAIHLTGISFKVFIRGVKPMFWLIMFTVMFQILFTVGGETLFQVGFIRISTVGLINAVYIFARLVLIIMMSTILTLTTSPIEITDGMEHLMRPLKRFGFPSHEIALMLSIALRYVPTLMDEAVKIMNAQRSRGVEFDEGPILQRIKAIIPVLLPLFVSAFNRAEEMATAMEARGYRGGEGRSKYRQLQYRQHDLWVLIGFVCLCTGLIVLRYLV